MRTLTEKRQLFLNTVLGFKAQNLGEKELKFELFHVLAYPSELPARYLAQNVKALQLKDWLYEDLDPESDLAFLLHFKVARKAGLSPKKAVYTGPENIVLKTKAKKIYSEPQAGSSFPSYQHVYSEILKQTHFKLMDKQEEHFEKNQELDLINKRLRELKKSEALNKHAIQREKKQLNHINKEIKTIRQEALKTNNKSLLKLALNEKIRKLKNIQSLKRIEKRINIKKSKLELKRKKLNTALSKNTKKIVNLHNLKETIQFYRTEQKKDRVDLYFKEKKTLNTVSQLTYNRVRNKL